MRIHSPAVGPTGTNRVKCPVGQLDERDGERLAAVDHRQSIDIRVGKCLADPGSDRVSRLSRSDALLESAWRNKDPHTHRGRPRTTASARKLAKSLSPNNDVAPRATDTSGLCVCKSYSLQSR